MTRIDSERALVPLRVSCVALLVSLISPSSGIAHHSSDAYFDTDRELTLQGTVTGFDWRNPHAYVYIDVIAEDGQTAAWRLEGGPIALLRRLGWTQDTLRPGDEVAVTVNPSRSPERLSALMVNAEVVGRVVPPLSGEAASDNMRASYSVRSTQPAQGLSGTWNTLINVDDPYAGATAFLNDPSEHPLTPAGSEAVETFDERTMHPTLRCIPSTAPGLMVFPDAKQIEIDDDIVSIVTESGTERVIYLDARDVPSQSTIQGNSLGRWEDGALIIETRNFAPHRMGNAYSLPSGASKQLSERLELNEDGTSLTYTFVSSDPEFMTEPLEGRVVWAYRPGLELAAVECSPDNARLFLED